MLLSTAVTSLLILPLIACVSVGLPPACVYIREVAPLSEIHNRHHIAFAPRIVVPPAVAAIADPIPSTAYTADGRAGLRNSASLDPVRERGD